MKLMPLKPALLAGAVFAALTLSGCAATSQQTQERSPQGGITEQEHQSHHPQGAASQLSPSAGQGTARDQGGMMGQGGGQMGMMGQGGQMDMKSMCAMHERMKSARSPQERGAMMDQSMMNMTPEMRQRQMEMMERQCK